MAEDSPAASSASAYVLTPIVGSDLVEHTRSLIPPRPEESPERLASLLSAPHYSNMLSGHLYEAANRDIGITESSYWTIFLFPEMTAVEAIPEVDAQTGLSMVVLSSVYLMRGDGPDPVVIRTKLQVRAGLLTREEVSWVIEAEGGECGWGGYYGVLEDPFWGAYTVIGMGARGIPQEVGQRLRERAERQLQKYDIGDPDDWY